MNSPNVSELVSNLDCHVMSTLVVTSFPTIVISIYTSLWSPNSCLLLSHAPGYPRHLAVDACRWTPALKHLVPITHHLYLAQCAGYI